jgi:hypothetical protein
VIVEFFSRGRTKPKSLFKVQTARRDEVTRSAELATAQPYEGKGLSSRPFP